MRSIIQLAMHLFSLGLFFLFPATDLVGAIDLGVDTFFKEEHHLPYQNKKIGLISNQTGVNKHLISTLQVLRVNQMKVVALFCPEHGWFGNGYAFDTIEHGIVDTIPLYSLHGETRRPTNRMLQGIDLLIYDIQDIGSRSYTYATTLFYIMEEAAKRNIPVVIFDRPNPLSGQIVDGGMLETKWRSFIGYINVPYCHGMTIGELASLFNQEYRIGCKLKVIPMKGWKRSMTFKETGLVWIPTSPNLPEADTPFFYASTGILGELGLVNIGIGYTLPFKVVGAPWIHAKRFADILNLQNIPGAYFIPFHYRPFYGSMGGKECHGVLIRITDSLQYQPLTVQYVIMGILKSLYPKEVNTHFEKMTLNTQRLFHLANGSDVIYKLMVSEKHPMSKMLHHQKKEREQFKILREKYLIYRD